MKKIFIILILVAAFIGLAVLVKFGIIRWQPLTMLLAAIAAPIKFIMGMFGSEEKIHQRHQAQREAEHAYQAELQSRISQREERIAALSQEVDALDSKLAQLKQEKETLSSQIATMSKEEKQALGKKLLGE